MHSKKCKEDLVVLIKLFQIIPYFCEKEVAIPAFYAIFIMKYYVHKEIIL